MRVIALIDGEHHPQVVRDALDSLARDHEIVSVLFVVGEEKVPADALAESRVHYGRDVVTGRELPAVEADVVYDLSGDPVLGLDDRLALAAAALDRGLEYRAPGLRLEPPPIEKSESLVWNSSRPSGIGSSTFTVSPGSTSVVSVAVIWVVLSPCGRMIV